VQVSTKKFPMYYYGGERSQLTSICFQWVQCLSMPSPLFPIKTSKLAKMVIQEVIQVQKFTTKQMEGQVVVASKPNVTVTNVLPVKVVRLAIIAQLIGVSRPTVSPTIALVTGAVTGSVANIVIATTIVFRLQE
ncbi:MAG: hypothetical protein EZS28_052731, partial [Streblomastix strix]